MTVFAEHATSTMNRNVFPSVRDGQFNGKSIRGVEARELHAFLQVGKKFADWIKDRIKKYDFVEGQDFVIYEDLSSPNLGSAKSRAQKTVEYAITLDMAKELAMVERSEKGRQVRRYFIECERIAKQAVQQQTAAFEIPQNYAAALRLAAQQSEQIEQQQAAIDEMKPKADLYEAFMNADGLYGLQNAARALNLRPNLFVRWLKTAYLFYQGANLVPYVRYRQLGIFDVRQEIGPDGKIYLQTYITPRGLPFFNDRVPENVKVRPTTEGAEA